jgi:hypothetical protein
MDLMETGRVMDLIDSAHGPVAGSSEQGNESSGSRKDGEFLVQLSEYELLK